MSWLTANLSSLSRAVGAPLRVPDADGRVRLEWVGQVPVLQLSTPSGPPIALNSRRDPLGEAGRAVERALAGRPNPGAVVAIGLGLGFVIDALADRCPDAKILALEPEPGCVRPLLERRDLTGLVSRGRLLLLWGPDYRGASEGGRFLGDRAGTPPILTHPVLARHNADAFRAARDTADRIVFAARSNAEARRQFAGRYLLNTLRNLPAIAGSGDAGALFGLFENVPGVIVSAGPSLDANLRDLAAIAGRAVLVAADTALRPLLAAGIHPHLGVAVDPSELNGRHLSDLPDTSPTHLVAEGSLDPAAFAPFGERVFTFKVSDHQPWPWLGSIGIERATLRAWGSVATSAFDLACRLGCNPIVFAGQDLAYTDGRVYCRGTTFERSWAEAVVDGTTLAEVWRRKQSATPLEVTDINGATTRTTPTFVAFRDWLVEQCRNRPERRFVNATGAGILAGDGVEQGALDEAIPPVPLRTNAVAAIEAARRTSSSSARAEVAAASEELLQGLRIGERPPIVTDWQEFAAQTVSIGDIRRALEVHETASRPDHLQLPAGSLAALQRVRGLDPREALPSTLRPPERVAAIRAASSGTAVPDWAAAARRGGSSDSPSSSLELAREGTELVCRLLSLREPVSGLLPGWEACRAAASEALSLTAPFDWAPDACRDVDRLERLVLLASAPAPPGVVPSGADALRCSVAATSNPPFRGREDALLPVPRETLAWWARRALLIEWARLLHAAEATAGTESPRLGAHLDQWLRDVAEGPFAVALDEWSVVLDGSLDGATDDRPRFRFDLRTPPWRLMRALTGAIVRADPANDRTAESQAVLPVVDLDLSPPAGPPRRLRCSLVAAAGRVHGCFDPRVRFFRRPAAWLHPTVLSLPSCYMAGRGDGTAAIVTPHLAASSWAVDSTGALTELAPWPHPIIGEEHGEGGGSVAWSNAGSWYLMRRASPQGPVETITTPFRPARAAILEDGTSLWSATTGGLWQWRPDGGLDCLATTPPVSGLTLTDSGVRLDPLARDVAGHGHRRLLTRGWLWRRATAEIADLELGPLGQMCRRAEGRRLSAEAYPAADLIRIGDGTGPRFDVACDWPNDVAWAGDSLVVVTALGTVLLFEMESLR